ncbi:hypothetical protein J6590_058186 [Homalodisca vitripennis]|nr:hypothetical protein J6590_058182 [Homalodisca vitripennis]KAG8301191.1 hypothetical protein J6590_058186 [Homalodisca vitripennis]
MTPLRLGHSEETLGVTNPQDWSTRPTAVVSGRGGAPSPRETLLPVTRLHGAVQLCRNWSSVGSCESVSGPTSVPLSWISSLISRINIEMGHDTVEDREDSMSDLPPSSKIPSLQV